MAITARSGNMTTNTSMPMIIDDMVELVIVNNEKVGKFKEVVVNENASDEPQVDDHESKA